MTQIDPFDKRRAGILLHPTSLPGAGDNGTLGAEAYRFVDFLIQAGQTVWQMLPLGPTHGDRSPYQCLSLYAGNPQLISLSQLQVDGWWSRSGADFSSDHDQALLTQACDDFLEEADNSQRRAWQAFCDQQAWLDDYALFQVIRQQYPRQTWIQWPAPLRDRQAQALADIRRQFQRQYEQIRVEQFFFFQQWQVLKRYANERGILLFGDMPIFVAHDSADVWAGREYFVLDETGQPQVVAGVPPDYFSATGQRWGNPHYHWPVHEKEKFAWWRQRIGMQLAFFDLVRIDHFRGFEAYWEIPAKHETAMDGRWVKAPGKALFSALRQHYGRLPLVAEDLGIITAEVDALRDQFALPGMKILQFAFDGNADNPYLPHNHVTNSIVYTGTHDNDTSLGWFLALSGAERDRVCDYLAVTDATAMPWPLIRCALASVARMAIVPLQDVLGLGSEQRMNIPGTEADNWRWRFEWPQLSDDMTQRMQHLTRLYGR